MDRVKVHFIKDCQKSVRGLFSSIIRYNILILFKSVSLQKSHTPALKLRLDLIEDVEGSLYFRFNIWSWQLVAKMDTKVVCKSLETGKCYRFLAKKEIETLQAYTSDACNIHPYKEICLIR